MPVVHLGGLDEVVVVEHQHQVLGQPAQVVEQGGERRLAGRRGRQQLQRAARRRRRRAPSGSPSTTYVQNSAGSSSRPSSDTQATAGAPARGAASHSVSTVVLPKPAGADEQRQRSARGGPAAPPARPGDRPGAPLGDAVLAPQERDHHAPIVSHARSWPRSPRWTNSPYASRLQAALEHELS